MKRINEKAKGIHLMPFARITFYKMKLPDKGHFFNRTKCTGFNFIKVDTA